MPNRRRLLTWVLLALVVVAGAAFGRVPEMSDPAALAVDAAHTAHAAHAEAHPDDEGAPCVLRADCAGAWTFGAAGLLLAVAVAVPAVGVTPTVHRLAAVPSAFHSALLPSGLFRPPQPS